MSSPRFRRWAIRIAVAIVLLAIMLEGAWLIGAPVALRKSLLPRLNKRPHAQRITWDAIDPGLLLGRVRVHGLAIDRRHATSEWSVRLDEADASIALRSLFGRELHVTKLRARGLDLRVRRLPGTVAPKEGDAPPDPVVQAAMQAASPPPLEWPGDPATAASTRPRRRNPWTYRFDDAIVEGIRDAWIGAYRFQGQASMSTALRVRPREAPEIDRAKLVIDAGSVTIAGNPALGEMAGFAEASTDGRPGPGAPGAAFVEKARARVKLVARTPRLTPDPFRLPTLRWLSLDGGAATVDVDLVANEGRLQSGSRFDLRVDDLSVALPSHVVTGTGSVIGRVSGAEPEAQVKVSFDEFTLANAGKAPHARGRGLWLGLTTPVTDLARPAERFRLVAEIPDSEITDLSAYASYAPPAAQLTVRGGNASLSAKLEATESDGHAEVHLRGSDVDATWKGTRLRGDFAMDSSLAQLDLLRGAFRVDGTTVSMTDWSVASGGSRGGESGWWARFEIPEGRVAAKEAVRFEARVTGRLRDSRPIFELLGARAPLVKLVKGALSDEDIAVSSRLEVRADRFAARDIDVKGRKLVARGCVSDEPGGLHAITWVDAGWLSAGIRRAPGDNSVRPLAGARWWEEHRDECR